MGIFHFGLDRKIPGNLNLILFVIFIQELGIWDFWNLWIFIPGIWDFYLEDLGFLSRGLGICIPRIFAKSLGYLPNSRVFYPGNWGFFYPQNFLGMGIFFRGKGYLTEKPPLRSELNNIQNHTFSSMKYYFDTARIFSPDLNALFNKFDRENVT